MYNNSKFQLLTLGYDTLEKMVKLQVSSATVALWLILTPKHNIFDFKVSDF